MTSAQFWLRLLPVIGLFQHCVSLRVQSIKVPLNYEDIDSARYDPEYIEYDIVDPKLRMWEEQDLILHRSHLKATRNPDHKQVVPEFATFNTRTVIPDQSELDQVDESALNRGHKEILVDKDDETLTEVIQSDAPPSPLPFTKSADVTLPPTTFGSKTKLIEKTLNVSNNSENQLQSAVTTRGQGQKVGENLTGNTELSPTSNSLQTVQIAGNNSSSSQRYANSSALKSAGELGDTSGIANSSQDSDSFPHKKNATLQLSLSKTNFADNSLDQAKTNPIPTTSSQGSYTEIYKESIPLENKPPGHAARAPNASNSTLFRDNVDTIKSNDSNTLIGTNSDGLTGVVNSSNAEIALKSVKASHNISETTQSTVDNVTEVVSIVIPEQNQNTMKESSVKNSISDGIVGTNASDIGQAGILNTNGTKTSTSEVALGTNSSLPISGGSERVDKLDKRLNVLQDSARDRGGSLDLLSPNVRRMNIIHHRPATTTSSPYQPKKAARKLQSFLTAVKEMFKGPETAQDIMSWEAWGPCSKPCGEGAVRTRQRKCGKLVERDFDVACPDPKEETRMCPVVPCLPKYHETSSQESQNSSPNRPVKENDQTGINGASGKHVASHRVRAGSEPYKFIGTENDVQQNKGDVSTTLRPNTEDETEDDESSTEDNESDYDLSSGQDYQNNVASFQRADQKRYVYTVWGSWSACTRTCGQRAYAFRKRYCINAVTGEIKRHCQRPTILAKKCVLSPCPVNGGLSDWSKWSSCSGSCGVMERHRSCTNPKPAYGGKECFKLPVQMRQCGTCAEDKVAAVQNMASYSPKVLCGFDPCQRVGCLQDKGAICVTDFECNPTFFDDEGQVLKNCKDSTQLFLRPLAQKKCPFNPCSFTKCSVHGAKCLVDTKCRPFFVDKLGKRVNCKGSNVLQISSELICGLNPCKITTCTVDPDAKCVTDYRCNPIFINSAGQKISGCTEDEVEEAERLATERPTGALQKTENPSTRDETQHYNPYLQYHFQESREEPSVKKSTQSNFHETDGNLKDVTLLDDDETIDDGDDEPDESLLENDIDKTEAKLKYITGLESILAQRLYQNQTSNSKNTTNSKTFENPNESDRHLSESTKANGVKLLENILQHRLQLNESSDLEKSKKFQENTKSQKDSENLNHDEVALVDGKELKTLHQSTAETTEIVDSPSFASESFHLPKNRDILKLDENLPKPSLLTNRNGADTIEKLFQSNAETDKMVESGSNAKATQRRNGSANARKKQEKNLADVDRFIQDGLNKEKMAADTGTTSLGLPGARNTQGKIIVNANAVRDYAGDNNFDIGKNKVGDISGYNNDINNDSVSSNDTLNSQNIKNTYLNEDNLNNSVIIDNETVLLNPQESILHSSLTDSTVDRENNTSNKHLTLTTTTNLVDDNNNKPENYDNNSNLDVYHNKNNQSFNHNTNELNSTMKAPETIPTIINSTTQNLSTTPQNATIHYDLRVPEIESLENISKTKYADAEVKIDSKLQNVSSGKKYGDRDFDIQGKIMPSEDFLAATKLAKELSDTGKMTTSKAQSDGNEYDDSVDESYGNSAGNVKLDSGNLTSVDGSSIEPEEDQVIVQTETSGEQNPYVIHSGEPDLEIPPYDEKVAGSALEKEQRENPEGLPSKAELNAILNAASAIDNQEQTITPENHYDQHFNNVLPHKSPGHPKHPGSNARPLLPLAQQDKQVYQVTSKPDNQATTSQSQTDLMNKLIAKAVQQELAKLKLDGLIKDALKSIETKKPHQVERGTDIKQTEHSKNLHFWPTPKPHEKEDGDIISQKLHSKFVSRPITGNIGVTRRPVGNKVYLRLPKGYHRVGLKALGKTRAKEFFTTPKPFHSKTISTNSPLFEDSKDTHYNEHEVKVISQPRGEADSIHQGEKPEKSQHQDNDDADLSEIEKFLESPHSELLNAKTTERPEHTTNTPEEIYNDREMANTPNEYTITIAPMREGDAEDHLESHRISAVNDEGHLRIKEPENKETYSQSLLDEIKELGLDEYYIKDGFQNLRVPKHGKFDAEQARPPVRYRNWQADNDNYESRKNHPGSYGKKFHVGQMLYHSALRHHNSEGDEIERVPNSYRDAAGVARSRTGLKKNEEAAEKDDILKETEASHVRPLTKYLDHLRHYVGGMDGDLLDSSLKGQRINDADEADLGNAIIFSAKDDSNAQSTIDGSENSTNDFKTRIYDNDLEKNDFIGSRVSDGDRDYGRNLRLFTRHPRLKTYRKQRQY